MPRILKKLLRLVGARGVQHVLAVFTAMIEELHDLMAENRERANKLRIKVVALETERAVVLAEIRRAGETVTRIQTIVGHTGE